VHKSHSNFPRIVVAHESFHAGVVGIVASRLVDLYHRPTFVLAKTPPNATARPLDPRLRTPLAIEHVRDLLTSGGGHAWPRHPNGQVEFEAGSSGPSVAFGGVFGEDEGGSMVEIDESRCDDADDAGVKRFVGDDDDVGSSNGSCGTAALGCTRSKPRAAVPLLVCLYLAFGDLDHFAFGGLAVAFWIRGRWRFRRRAAGRGVRSSTASWRGPYGGGIEARPSVKPMAMQSSFFWPSRSRRHG